MSSCIPYACPPADKGNHNLGPSSHIQGSTLFCTYATSTRVDNSDTFCTYDKVSETPSSECRAPTHIFFPISQSSGSLLLDYDGGLCFDHALQQECASSASRRGKHAITTAAVAGSLGGLAFILACATAYFFYNRRRAAKSKVTAV